MNSEDRRYNGSSYCRVNEWSELVEQVARNTDALNSIREDFHYVEAIAKHLEDIKDKYVNTMLGKDITPIGVTQSLLEGQRTAYVKIITLISVIFGVIILVLVGLKALAPQWFNV